MELHGKSVFGGIAMGRLSVYHKTDNAVKRTKITDIEAEKKRFEDAKEEAKRQLGVFYEKANRCLPSPVLSSADGLLRGASGGILRRAHRRP